MEILHEKHEWNALLTDHFPQYQDTYFRFEYFDLYRRHYGVKPEGISWQDGNLSLFLPHLVRSLRRVALFRDQDGSDLTTPYGYGGPLLTTKTDDTDAVLGSLLKFRDEYLAFGREEGYVSEFVRFHPVFRLWQYFPNIFDLQHVNDTVVVDLTKGPKELWDQLSKNTRRYVSKSRDEFPSVKMVRDPTEDDFRVFFSLYRETMEHQQVPQPYFFPEPFLRDHFGLLDSYFISCQNPAGDTGSIALFFRGSTILHYHLGATNYRYRSSPLREVLWESILAGKQLGCTRLHLGGGRSMNDSLFAFKAGFSPDTCPFYIGKLVFDPEAYRDLVRMNPAALTGDTFFPLYRKGTGTTIME